MRETISVSGATVHAAPFWQNVDQSAGPDGCWPWRRGRSKEGYGKLSACSRHLRAHRVAYAFAKGDIPAGQQVRHTCDNPPCCNPAHLIPGTHLDNMADKVARQRQSRGETNGQSKLSAAAVVEVRERRAAGEPLAAIGEALGISESTVCSVATGKSWTHVDAAAVEPAPRRKLTADQVAQVRAAVAGGEQQRAIAERLGVSTATVSMVARGRRQAGEGGAPVAGRARRPAGAEAQAIRDARAGGEPVRAIASRLGFCESTIRNVLAGRP